MKPGLIVLAQVLGYATGGSNRLRKENVMAVPSVIHAGSGVVLKRFVAEDAALLFELVEKNREHIARWGESLGSAYKDVESVKKSITNYDVVVRFGIWHGAVLIGSIAVSPSPYGGSIGYWIGEAYVGKGYATAATRALCSYAKRELGYGVLTATAHESNVASQIVLLKSSFKLNSLDHKSRTMRYIRE